MTFNFAEGEILLIDKPLCWTSFDVVRKVKTLIRKKFGLKKIKVGHAGTLDPLATGLMIVATGKNTKQLNQLLEDDKEYYATIFLGATTPSFDLETAIDAEFPTEHITKELFIETMNSFRNEIEQFPPRFSAKFIDGERAYEMARKGKQIEMKPITVFISELELIDFNLPYVKLRVACSKGTYIRSLAHDIGKALQSGSHLVALRRSRSGKYLIDSALTIKEFENMLASL